MLAAIDASERLITVENTREYRLEQPNKVHLLYTQGEGGYANIKVGDLLVATMRMRPDRVLLQELLDSEAASTYVQSIVSGHPGSFTTIHGRDAAQAFKKLFGLIQASDIGRGQDSRWIVDLLSSAVDIILPFENHGMEFEIGEVFFAPDAARRGESVANLLEEF
jgi:type IV secretion system protein VirB11